VGISYDKSIYKILFILTKLRLGLSLKSYFAVGKSKKKHRQRQKDQPLGETMLDEGSGQPSESVELEKDEPLCKAEMEEAQQYESVALEVPGTRHREYIK